MHIRMQCVYQFCVLLLCRWRRILHLACISVVLIGKVSMLLDDNGAMRWLGLWWQAASIAQRVWGRWWLRGHRVDFSCWVVAGRGDYNDWIAALLCRCRCHWSGQGVDFWLGFWLDAWRCFLFDLKVEQIRTIFNTN